MGRGGSSNWVVARASHKEEMSGDIYAHNANLRSGVFSFAAQDADDQHYVGFHERTDPKTYKFKTVQISTDTEMASSKMRGRICANDTDKVANINPMLTALLRRKLASRGPRAEDEIVDIIKDKLDSTCVLAELLLRYYDSESDDKWRQQQQQKQQQQQQKSMKLQMQSAAAPSAATAATRWYLAPCEMQILVKVMQWLKEYRQKQLRSR